MARFTAEQAERVRNSKEDLVARLFPEVTVEPRPGADVAVSRLGQPIPLDGNIIGVGYGPKITGGRHVGTTALRVYVRRKLPRDQVPPGQLVPADVGSDQEFGPLVTDVIQVGEVWFLQRPVRGGASIGHADITAGTMACVVTLEGDEAPHILSNNHVMADVNRAELGDPVLEPGPSDGGTEPIAELSDFEPIITGGEDNAIDAAVASVLDPEDVETGVEGIGAIAPTPVDAELDALVRKQGRTSGLTDGQVVDISVDLWVQVDPQMQMSAWFTDQVGVGATADAEGPFSEPGDSGSLVVAAESQAAVGLLFAGGEDHTFANPIGAVLDRFGADIATEAEE